MFTLMYLAHFNFRDDGVVASDTYELCRVRGRVTPQNCKGASEKTTWW